MNLKLYRFLLVILPFLALIGWFEILNIDAYYKDLIEVPQILIQQSNAPAKAKAKDIAALVCEGEDMIATKRVVELLTVTFASGWIFIILEIQKASRPVPNEPSL